MANPVYSSYHRIKPLSINHFKMDSKHLPFLSVFYESSINKSFLFVNYNFSRNMHLIIPDLTRLYQQIIDARWKVNNKVQESDQKQFDIHNIKISDACRKVFFTTHFENKQYIIANENLAYDVLRLTSILLTAFKFYESIALTQKIHLHSADKFKAYPFHNHVFQYEQQQIYFSIPINTSPKSKNK